MASSFRNPIAWLGRLAICVSIALVTPAAADTTAIGILALRPKAQTLERWQALAGYLESRLPERQFRIVALDYVELDAAVERRQIDFVLTNPAHFAVLHQRKGVGSPAATLIESASNTVDGMFGGTILVRDERQDIRHLDDLARQRIAVVSQSSLGGYLSQAYEVQQAGARLPPASQLIETGMPHDLAVLAVIEGKADAAFVRAGVLETMQREGKLDASQLRVLNPQSAPGIPFALSTRLYPGWAFAALPGTAAALNQQVVAALLTLPADSSEAQAMQIRGFGLPANYDPVTQLLAEVRPTPYTHAPQFRLADIWQRYPWQSAGLLVVILIALLGLLASRGRWRRRERLAHHQARALASSEALFRTVHQLSPNGMVLTRLSDRRIFQANAAACRIVGYSEEALCRMSAPALFGNGLSCNWDELAGSRRCGPLEVELQHCDGGQVPVRIESVLLRDGDGDFVLTVLTDLSEEKRRQYAHWELGLFTGGPVVVFVWLPSDGWPVDYVSPNIVDLLGYSVEEIRAPGFRFSGLIHPDDLARAANEVSRYLGTDQQQFEQSYRLRHKNGSYHWFYDFTVPERDAAGKLTRIRGYLFDQTRMKQVETALDRERERLANIIEGTNVGTWEWNIQTGELLLNERWATMLGYCLAELAPVSIATWQTLAHPDDLAESHRQLQRHFDGDQEHYAHECRMRHKDGHWVWVLDRGKLIRRDADGKPWLMAGTHADITERKAAEEEIHRLAYYDQLTGLPNRRLLVDRLTLAQAASARSQRYGALLLIDLDHFKQLNDTLGHGMGDRLLIEVAARLQQCTRAGDTVARFSGDEYVVMLVDLGDTEEHACELAETIADKIRGVLNLPYHFDSEAQESYHNTPSIGISLFRDHDQSIDTLLRQADLAMYQAKDGGRNTIRFYSQAMQAAIDMRTSIERGLRRALSDGELSLHFQPQVNTDGSLIGAEALLRWQRPDARQVGPDRFIPIAEESGLILPIGDWILDRACTTLQSWHGSAPPGRLSLAVNVSARQFHQVDFVDNVRRLLDHYGTDPTRLKLELTESIVLDNLDDAVAKMRQLKALGVSFSLDDFGTGYSSLSYLKRLPIDQLKIDRSFVRDIATDPDDAAIVRAILGMSQALHLDVVAEGVETEAQRDFLERSGCRTFQGYLFGRPVPRADFDRLLQ